MEDALVFLQKWYLSQCDGEWEHSYGIELSSLDNPGWHIEIDLTKTALENKLMPLVDVCNGTGDWANCRVHENKFIGAGDPSKLGEILSHFQSFVALCEGKT